MIIWDAECEIRLGQAAGESQRQAFSEAAGALHAGWYGPLPVVSWKGGEEALVLLVLKGATPGEEPDAAETVCRDAEGRIREWAEQAGIAGAASDGMAVSCRAIPRI
jgi:hypothetical protein